MLTVITVLKDISVLEQEQITKAIAAILDIREDKIRVEVEL